MSESEIEGFINKVESGLVEAQHDMLVEKALYNRPVVRGCNLNCVKACS